MKAEIKVLGTPVPCVVHFTPGRVTIDRLQPVPVNTKHPSLSVWNSKATMWGQG
jgi:hypothetical protein